MGGFSPIQKIISKPQVQAAMAPKPVKTPAGPTTVEAVYDKSKRRGRKATLLTSSKGVSSDAEIQLKTLLGG